MRDIMGKTASHKVIISSSREDDIGSGAPRMEVGEGGGRKQKQRRAAKVAATSSKATAHTVAALEGNASLSCVSLCAQRPPAAARDNASGERAPAWVAPALGPPRRDTRTRASAARRGKTRRPPPSAYTYFPTPLTFCSSLPHPPSPCRYTGTARLRARLPQELHLHYDRSLRVASAAPKKRKAAPEKLTKLKKQVDKMRRDAQPKSFQSMSIEGAGLLG